MYLFGSFESIDWCKEKWNSKKKLTVIFMAVDVAVGVFILYFWFFWSGSSVPKQFYLYSFRMKNSNFFTIDLVFLSFFFPFVVSFPPRHAPPCLIFMWSAHTRLTTIIHISLLCVLRLCAQCKLLMSNTKCIRHHERALMLRKLWITFRN